MRKAMLDGNPYAVQREVPFILRDTTCRTEQAGYVDAESQIKRLLYAGENLMSWKREFYDFPDGEFDDDVSPDPTEALGFDPVDAQILMESARKRLMWLKAAADSHKDGAAASAEQSGVEGTPETPALTDSKQA